MRINKTLSSLEESPTIKLNSAVGQLIQKGVDVINLTAGELDFPTPSFLKRAVEKKLTHNKYTPTLGLPQLRDKIAEFVKREYRLPIKRDNIAVTAGAKQALFEIFQAILEPKDEVIIPTPAWVSYEHQVKLSRGTPIFVPLGSSFDLDVSKIRRELSARTKAIILNSPHNPTGAVFSRGRLQELGKLVWRKDIFIIVDDIYQKLVFTNHYHSPALFINKKDHLILINGFSKSQALTGWRIGFVVAHPKIIKIISAYQSHTSGNASLPAQFAALESLRQNVPSRQYVIALKQRRKIIHNLLNQIPCFSYHQPQGAFYFFINIKKVEENSTRFCQLLLEQEHVALVPGEAFKAPGFVRLSFAASEKDLLKGLKRLTRFVQNY